MLEDLNKPQKIFMIILYVLTAIASITSVFVIYNLANVAKPWTLGVTYSSVIETSNNQSPIVNVKIHSNENNNGLKVIDIQFNSYMDTQGNSINGFGIQCVGEYEVYNRSGYDIDTIPYMSLFTDEKEAYTAFSEKCSNLKYKEVGKSKVYGDFYTYYTADNSITYQAINYSDVPNYLLISINNESYRLSLKEYTYTYQERNWFEDLFGLKGNTVEVKTTFTWFEVFEFIANSAINNSGKAEFESFSLPALDLARYLTIEYMDNKGQYHEMPDTSENRNYLTIPVEYSVDGAAKASDSLFKQVQSSPTWSIYNNTDVENYWNAYSILNLTEANLNYVYNDDKKAYYAEIDEEFANYLNSLGKTEISLNINLENLNFNVYGIDLMNFDIHIKSFEILTDSVSDFIIYNSDMCETTPTIKAVA